MVCTCDFISRFCCIEKKGQEEEETIDVDMRGRKWSTYSSHTCHEFIPRSISDFVFEWPAKVCKSDIAERTT